MSENVRGQYLTKSKKLQKVVQSLLQNKGIALEPSAGKGHLLQAVEGEFNDVTAVEIDSELASSAVSNTTVKVGNFLSCSFSRQFDSVFGNPPYLKRSNVLKSDEFYEKSFLDYPSNANLYFYFIEKSIKLLRDGGELVFICPKDFFWNESALNLRSFIWRNGSITDFVKCEQGSYFQDASLESLIIFRYVKSETSNKEINYYENVDSFFNQDSITKVLEYYKRELFCLSQPSRNYSSKKQFQEVFDIHIGNVVTGKDSFFKVEPGRFDERYTKTVINTKGGRDTLLYLEDIDSIKEIKDSELANYLLEHKSVLINRGIKNFTEKNWWKWGTLKNVDNTSSSKGRILLRTKTRKNEKCWIERNNLLVSSALIVLVPKTTSVNLEEVRDYINGKQFDRVLEDFQMKTGTKRRITTKNLRRLPLPIEDSTQQFFYYER